MLTGAGDIVRKTDARADVFVVVARNLADIRIRDRAVKRDEFLIGATAGNERGTESIEVFVPTNAEIQSEAACDLVIILEVKTKLLGRDEKIWIAVGDRHTSNGARSSKLLRVEGGAALIRAVVDGRENAARVCFEIDFQG